MGPYPETRSGNKFLLVATDFFSKWVEAKAVKDIKTKATLDFLQEVCSRWGYPQRVITDNGANFRTHMWGRYLEQHGIEGYYTPVYHQRANPVERRNQEIKKLLRLHLRDEPQNRWDERLKEILFTLRNRANASTGIAPSEALLGAQLPIPGEWRQPRMQAPIQNRPQDREERIQRVRARQEVYARRLYPGGDPPITFRVGDQVLVRSFTGVRPIFGAPWVGPFPVMAIRGNDVYEVDRNGSQMPIHVDDMRPAPGQQAQNQAENEQQRPNEDRFINRFHDEVVNRDNAEEDGERSEAAGGEGSEFQLGDRVPGRARDSSSPAPGSEPQPSTSRVNPDEVVQVHEIARQQTKLRYRPTLPTIEDCESDEEDGPPPKRSDAVWIIGLHP